MAFKVFPDLCNHPKENKDVCDLIFCIQNFVHKRRVRVKEFLECFDHLRTGTITKNQFERALDNVGVRKYLTQRNMNMLFTRYKDPIDTNRIMWRLFEDEIDKGIPFLRTFFHSKFFIIKTCPYFKKFSPSSIWRKHLCWKCNRHLTT